MVREVVTLQVGQCGIRLGNKWWDRMLTDHMVTPDGSPEEGFDPSNDNTLSYFQDTVDDKFKPHAVLVDLDPGSADVIKASTNAGLYSPDQMVFGTSSAGNNFAKGYYTDGAEVIDAAMEAIRKQVEACGSLGGVQLFHSLGGGTGSGLGSSILTRLRDAYMSTVLTSYSVVPSAKVSSAHVAPYNAVLCSHQLINHADVSHVIDNEALYNINSNVLKKDPTTDLNFANLNYLMAGQLMDATAAQRFVRGYTPHRFVSDMIPFPRTHFLTSSSAYVHDRAAPFEGGDSRFVDAKTAAAQAPSPLSKPPARRFVATAITSEVLSASHLTCDIKHEDGSVMATHAVVRGPDAAETDSLQKHLQSEWKKKCEDAETYFCVDFNPTAGERADLDVRMATAAVTLNTTAMKGVFQRLATEFDAMYEKKAFAHWYTGEGMDHTEFLDAVKNVRDLITEFQGKQDYIGNDE